MAMSSRSRRSQVTNYWPGFVDALSSLLLVIIFLLSLFMLSQFFLGQEISGKDTAMSRLNAQIAELTEMLQLEKGKTGDLDTTIATLQATLATTAGQRDQMASQLAGMNSAAAGDGKDAQIADLTTQLQDEQDLSKEAAAQVALLNQQLAALRSQIGALEQALQASEAKDTENRGQIANLGKRLNVALAQRVQDLSRYRSDFFGKLRQVLEGRADVRIVGDRFVFQSEVLFEAGKAEISTDGETELGKLAAAIKDLESQIPADVNWVLRIDGHTDRRPIHTDRFPSNWELSTARAVAIVKYLVVQGIPAHRLSANGFGQFQPIDTADTPEAYAKNRRIELQLTNR